MMTTGMNLRVAFLALCCTLACTMVLAQVVPRVQLYDSTTSWETLEEASPSLRALDALEAGGVLKGQPVIRNGRLTVAFTNHGIELYSVDVQGAEHPRARLAPLNAQGKASRIFHGAVLIESSKNIVELAVSFAGDGGEQRLNVVLKRDEVTAEIKPVAGVQSLQISSSLQYLVVPAFVGDDFIFDPAEYPAGHAFLPSENILLGLLSGGDAMLQTVWPIGDQQVYVDVAGNGNRALESLNITFAGHSIFVATWEAPGLWAKGDCHTLFRPTVEETPFAWQPPYAAQWRSVFHGKGCDTTWVFREGSSHEVLGQHGGRSATYVWPAWFEHGTTYLHLPPQGIQEVAPDFFLLYALRRAPSTPVATRLPEDVLREALGSGPCEYLLNLEGISELAAPGGPLCILNGRYSYLSIINDGSPKTSEYMLLHADYMLEQGLQEYQRVKEYKEFGLEIVKLCAKERKNDPTLGKSLEKIENDGRGIVVLCENINKGFAQAKASFVDFIPKANEPEGVLRELHAELKRVLHQHNPESLAECDDLERKLTSMAGYPQAGLPDPRRLTRLIQYEAAQLAPINLHAAQLSKEIRAKAGNMLRGKHWSEMGE